MLFPKSSHNFRLCHAIETSFLLFPRMNEEKENLGKHMRCPLVKLSMEITSAELALQAVGMPPRISK